MVLKIFKANDSEASNYKLFYFILCVVWKVA